MALLSEHLFKGEAQHLAGIVRWLYLGLFYLGLFSKLEAVSSAGSIVAVQNSLRPKQCQGTHGAHFGILFIYFLLPQLA